MNNPKTVFLFEWLLVCRNKSGPMLPVNFRRKRWALSRAMGWREWPDDILRHSFDSYHLAKYRNAALTAEQMGHKNATDNLPNKVLVREYLTALPDEKRLATELDTIREKLERRQ
jgi:integrase